MSSYRPFLYLLVVSLLFVASAALVVESESEIEIVPFVDHKYDFDSQQQWAPLVESLDEAMAEERAGLALVELEEKIHNYFATTPATKASVSSKKTPSKTATAVKATKPSSAAKKSSSKSAKPTAASKKRATRRPAAERLSSDEQKAKWARFKAANPKKRYQSAAAEQRAFAQFCANRAKIVANNDAVGNELNPTPFKSSGPLADVSPDEFKSKFLRSRRGSEQGTRLPSREADAATKRLGALPKTVATPAKAAAKTKQTNAKSSTIKKSSIPKAAKPTAARQARFMQVVSETEAELDAEAEIDSEQEAESDLEAAVDDQAEAEADQTAEADADILVEMGADMEIDAEMEGESEWEPAGEIDFRIDEDESHSTYNLVEVSADAALSGTPQGRVVGASGTVAGASGTVAGASGTVAGASGTVAGASGTVAGASGTVAGASGTVAGASGTVAGASGTVAGASGTVAGASGTVAGASGTVAGASGTTAGQRVIVAPAQAIELQKFQPFKGPVILNPADKSAEQRICRAVTTVWFRRYAHTPAQKLWQFGVKLFNGGASKFLDDPMKLCVTDWARVIGQGLHPEQRYIQSAYAELVERPSNTHFVNPYVATNDEPRDQSQCGSCWAQAAIGSYEAALKKVNQYKGPLSIQHVLDCATGKDALGCHGGTPQAALSFLSKNPPVLEADYPYTGVTSKCQTNKKGLLNLKKTSGWAFATKSCTKGKCEDQFGYETELLFAVKKDGPFIAYVDASSWQYYGGGIFPHAKCSSTSDAGNHVVQLLGYGQEAGVPYWLIKNSWDRLKEKNGLLQWNHDGRGRNQHIDMIMRCIG